MAATQENTICLVDGSGYIFRAFYALPPMTRPDGTPVNAVYGFMNMLMQLVSERGCAHIVVVFDAARRNFRNNIYPAYKETRKKVPAELIPQFPLIREACRLLNIPQIEMEGYEADDLIATYARIARDKGWQVQIISADKDLMQLMRDGVKLYDPMKRKELTNDDVIAKFGVLPNKVVDVQSFMGDSTDNVPGAAGIGPKTAAELINQFGSVTGVYENLHHIKSEKRRAGLERDKELVFISQKLVQLDNQVPVQAQPEEFVARMPQEEPLFRFLNENNFKSLINKMNGWLQKQANFLETFAQKNEPEIIDEKTVTTDISAQPSVNTLSPENNSPALSEKAVIGEITSCLVETQAEWHDLYQKIQQARAFAFQIYIHAENKTPMGVAITVSGHEAYYVPLDQSQASYETDLFAFQSNARTDDKTDYRTVLSDMAKLLNDNTIHKIGFGIKEQLHNLRQATNHIPDIQNYDDVLIQNYVLNGTGESQTLTDVYSRELGRNLPLLPEVKKKKGVPSIEPDIAQYCTVRTAQVSAIYTLYTHFKPQTDGNNIYNKVDLPLIPILFQMENVGILIDKMHLARLNSQFTQEINQLINQIYELAGEEFNINSPAQIATILFEKLGLKAEKKNAGGSLSTNVGVLEKLAEEGNDIARLILQYRMFV